MNGWEWLTVDTLRSVCAVLVAVLLVCMAWLIENWSR